MKSVPVYVGEIILQPEEMYDLYEQIKKAFCSALPSEKISCGVIDYVLDEFKEEIMNSPLNFFDDSED